MGLLTTGVDISHHNGHIDFGKLKANGVQFVIVKASEAFEIDPMFEFNYAHAHEAGLLCGAYHFFRTNVDAVNQMNHFLRVIPPRCGDLIHAIDVETDDGGVGVYDAAHAAVMQVKHITGRYPFLYSGMSFYHDYLSDITECPLWIARYGLMIPSPMPQIWQFSDHAKLGAPNPTDGNRFYGSLGDLITNHTYL